MQRIVLWSSCTILATQIEERRLLNSYTLHQGDCLDLLRGMADNSVDSIVTDPPSGIGFMGKDWDKDKGGRAKWIAWMKEVAAECLRVIKPGGHALVWSIPRTSHWTGMAWEEAGWEPRDKCYHAFGSGFPKSRDVGKAIDAEAVVSCPVCNGVGQIPPFTESFNDWIAKTRAWGGTRKEWERLSENKTETVCRICNGAGLVRGAEREVVGAKLGHENFVGRDSHSLNNGRARPWANDVESVARYHHRTAPATPEAEQWDGWGTALKPAVEEWWLFRKPLENGLTVAGNVLKWGTGGINVDGCRVGDTVETWPKTASYGRHDTGAPVKVHAQPTGPAPKGRWPSHLVHDGSDEVVALFPETGASKANTTSDGRKAAFYQAGGSARDGYSGERNPQNTHDDSGGSVARFFYCAKASQSDRDDGLEDFFWWKPDKTDRWHRVTQEGYGRMQGENAIAQESGAPTPYILTNGNIHETVKPTELMRWLCRLITPPNGLILDPFTGSGSTGKGAILEGFRFEGIEMDENSLAMAEARLRHASMTRGNTTGESIAATPKERAAGQISLFEAG
jgi:hypothetical protein